MPIRIRHSDNKHQEAQVAGSEGILVVVLAILTASYTDYKSVFRIFMLINLFIVLRRIQ